MNAPKPAPSPHSPTPAAQAAVAGQHYENFPVASLLCPPRLRPPIAAIYRFARTADDIADEGSASAEQRLADLSQFRADLQAVVAQQPHSGRWPQVFDALAPQVQAFDLPPALLHDLLDAFEQDIVKTRDAAGYANRTELLDYCRRSANPVGRLLLHLYGVADAASLQHSDAICTALQLINFWQDLSRDLPRQRYYLPEQDCAQHGLSRPNLLSQRNTAATVALVAQQCTWARTLMLQGVPLVHRVGGRAGWELRLVVQGGLRVLDKIASMDHQTLAQRPKLGPPDVLLMLWRALWM